MPLEDRAPGSTVRDDALGIAQELEEATPTSSSRTCASRCARARSSSTGARTILAKTTVAVYSLRARTRRRPRPRPSPGTRSRPAPSGASPDPLVFTPAETLARVEADGDLFEGLVG